MSGYSAPQIGGGSGVGTSVFINDDMSTLNTDVWTTRNTSASGTITEDSTGLRFFHPSGVGNPRVGLVSNKIVRDINLVMQCYMKINVETPKSSLWFGIENIDREGFGIKENIIVALTRDTSQRQFWLSHSTSLNGSQAFPNTTSYDPPNGASDCWLRLIVYGNRFAGYISTNDQNNEPAEDEWQFVRNLDQNFRTPNLIVPGRIIIQTEAYQNQQASVDFSIANIKVWQGGIGE